MNPHEWVDIGTRVVVVCSLVHTFAPPWDADALAPFPTIKNYYRLFIYIVGYVALNARSTVYKSISVNNPTGVNANSTTTNGGKQ
jgi:hypothetical protein